MRAFIVLVFLQTTTRLLFPWLQLAKNGAIRECNRGRSNALGRIYVMGAPNALVSLERMNALFRKQRSVKHS